MKPRLPLILLIAFLFVIATIASVWQMVEKQPITAFHQAVWLLLVIVIWTALADYLLSRKKNIMKIQRILPQNIILGKDTQVKLIITSTDPKQKQPLPITVGDCLPPDWTTDTPEITTELLPMSHYGVEISYTATPMLRGETHFGGTDYSLPSRFGLWQMIFRQPENNDTPIKVLPDFADIYGADLMSFRRWLQMVGVKKSVRRGEGQDFFQLRDFQDGDNIRHIDWKATARNARPIVRQFQDEKDRQIVFLLDCSYEMQPLTDGKSILDHALTALLLLSYTATHHGDAVGLMTCNAENERFIPPAKGVAQVSQLINHIYDIEPTRQVFDLENAVERLLSQQKRRAWIIIITTLDNDNAQDNIVLFKRLQKHFPILTVGLRTPAAQEIINTPIENTEESHTYIGAKYRLDDEIIAIKKLTAAQIPCLATYPQQLTAELINHYLNRKKSGAW